MTHTIGEWGTSAVVEHETIRATVEAYAAGKIQLETPGKKTPHMRYAPSFIDGDVLPHAGEHPYTASTIAKFLGWTKSNGDPQNKVHVALTALQFIEEGLLSEDDFSGLGTSQAEAIIQQAAQRRAAREALAKAAEAEAKRAKAEVASAKSDEARKMALRRQLAREQEAVQHRQKGREEATQVGRQVGSVIKSGERGYKQAAQIADEVVPLKPKAPRDIDDALRAITRDIESLFDDDLRAQKINALLEFKEDIDEGVKEFFLTQIDQLIGRLETIKGEWTTRKTRRAQGILQS